MDLNGESDRERVSEVRYCSYTVIGVKRMVMEIGMSQISVFSSQGFRLNTVLLVFDV